MKTKHVRERSMANGYEQEVTRLVIGSCGVARSIIAGFHPADPGSNPGTSTNTQTWCAKPVFLLKRYSLFEGGYVLGGSLKVPTARTLSSLTVENTNVTYR